MKKRYRIVMCLGLAAIVIGSLAAMGIGRFFIAPHDVIRLLLGRPTVSNAAIILWNVRLPRICMSVLAGAGLAAAGLAFQSLFANPLATPDTLGTAQGASFGAALGILFGWKAGYIQVLAMLYGIMAVFLVLLVTSSLSKGDRRFIIAVILAGMVISSLFSSLVSLMKYIADPQDQLPAITFWLMGGFSGVTRRSLFFAAPVILGGIVLLFALRFRLNALSLSEEEAVSLGMSLPLLRMLVILSASAITASIVAICGVIGWVGLLVPHMARMLVGNDVRRCMPASIVLGGLFLLGVDTVARTAASAEIPVSVLTAVIGAPVFILLLRKTGGIQT